MQNSRISIKSEVLHNCTQTLMHNIQRKYVQDERMYLCLFRIFSSADLNGQIKKTQSIINVGCWFTK